MKLGEELKDMEGTEDVEFTVSAGASGAPKEDSCLILLECRGGARLSDACGGAARRLRDGDSVRFCEKEVSVPSILVMGLLDDFPLSSSHRS